MGPAADGRLVLGAAWPNPATSGASVPFTLGEAAAVEAVLFDGLGRRVAVLAQGAFAAGPHALAVDGAGLPAGVYVVHVTARTATGPSGAPVAGPSVAVARLTLTR